MSICNKQGTHDIQSTSVELVVNSSKLEMLDISCHYAATSRGSTAVGCFMIALHWNRDTPPLYRALYKTQPSDEETRFTFNGFDIKSMHIYEIECNLLPGRFPAITKKFQVNNEVDSSVYKG